MAIFDSTNTITSTNTVAVNSSSQVIMGVLANSTSYADDAAAAAGGVPFGGLYRNGSDVRICLINPGGGEFDPDPFVPTADGTPTFLTSPGTFVNQTGTQVTPPNGNIIYPSGVSRNDGAFLVSDAVEYIYMRESIVDTIYRSSDYGQSFQNVGFAIGTSYADLARAMSKNGEYVYIQTDVTANGIRFSSDYGNSFSPLSITGVTDTSQATIRTSSGGKFVWISFSASGSVGPNSRKIFKSFDYGSSFVDVTNLILPTTTTYKTITVGLSGDGRVINVYERENSLGGTVVYRSLDYGQTFTKLSNVIANWNAVNGIIIETNQDGSVLNTIGTAPQNPGSYKFIYTRTADQPNPTYTSTFNNGISNVYFGLSNYGEYGYWESNSNDGNFYYINAQGTYSSVQTFNGQRVISTVNL
jgi:hypothetical protein